MDVNHIQEESKHLIEKLNSNEVADSFYAVNKYFDTNARVVHGPASVKGVSQIKKILNLETYTRDGKAKTLKGPTYDSQKGIIKFQSEVCYQSPNLPSFIPFAKSFSGRKSTSVYNWRIFVAPNSDEQGDGGAKGQKLFVTKWEEDKDTRAFLESLFLTIMTPIMTLIALTVSSVLTFHQAHKTEGYATYTLSAATEAINAFWLFILAETGRRQAVAEKWRDEKIPQLRQFGEQAYNAAWDTASKVQADIENRAKAAGIPLDDYKKQATAAITDLAENLEARAKAAGVPVEEYKKQAEAVIEDLKKRAGELGEWAQQTGEETVKEAKKKGTKAKKNVQKSANELTQDTNGHSESQTNGSTETNGSTGRTEEEIRADFAITPRTPLGGHDPTAAHAPSFAEAAKI